MAAIFILALGGIGGFMYLKVNKGKKKKELPDPDADYPYEDDDYLADMDIEEDVSEESEGSSNYDDINDEPNYQDESKGE